MSIIYLVTFTDQYIGSDPYNPSSTFTTFYTDDITAFGPYPYIGPRIPIVVNGVGTGAYLDWIASISRFGDYATPPTDFPFVHDPSYLLAPQTIITISPSVSSSVNIDEDGAPGLVFAHLSSASATDITIHVDASPTGWGEDLVLNDFTIPAGITDLLVPIVSAKLDHFPEPIESGNLLFSVTNAGPNVHFSTGGNSVDLVVKDKLLLDSQSPEFNDGFAKASLFIEYWDSVTKIAAAFYEQGDAILTAAQARSYEEAVGRIATFAGVAIDATVAGTQLLRDLTVAGTYNSALARAEAAYTAYETFDIEFTNSVIKTLVTATGATLATEFAVGFVAGLGLGATAAAAVPALAAVAVGWTGKVLYDDFLAERIKQDLKAEHEQNNPKVEFLNGYLSNANLPSLVHLGYIKNASVFVDSNGNKILDSGESIFTTDDNGAFLNNDTSGQVIVSGGVDTSTGLPLLGRFLAPAGSSIISPLSTLVAMLQSGGLPDASQAAQKVLSAFALPNDFDLLRSDPIAGAKAGNTTGGFAEVAGAKVYDTVSMIGAAMAGVGGNLTTAMQDTFAALAATINGSGLNLVDQNVVTALIGGIAQTEELNLAPGLASDLATLIVVLNKALDDKAGAETGQPLLDDTAAVELFAQGAASKLVQSMASEPDSFHAFVSALTPSALADLIADARTHVDHLGDNSAPLAFGAKQATTEDTPLQGSLAAIDLNNDSLTYSVVGTAPAGFALAADGSFSFDPRGHYDYLGVGESASATIHFKTNDGHSDSNTATQTIAITGVNDAPVAHDDSAGVKEDGKLKASTAKGVLANDSDPDSHDHISVIAVNGQADIVGRTIHGKYGTLNLNADGSYVYRPSDGDLPKQLVAQDTFSYTISDGHGGKAAASLNIVLLDEDQSYKADASGGVLKGDNQQNVLDGSAGHITALGGKGADVLIGGPGDTLTGGGGGDTFLFRPNFGTSTITDFDFRRDHIQADRSMFASADDFLKHTVDTPAGAQITDAQGDLLTLTGVTLAQLQAHQHHELLLA